LEVHELLLVITRGLLRCDVDQLLINNLHVKAGTGKPHVMNVHLIHIGEDGQRRRGGVSHRSTPVQQRMESLEERSMHYSGCLLSNDESEPPLTD
jgi:hypothetical protein